MASGSNEFPANTKNYQDRFFINDGKGNFTSDSSALPVNYTSKSCVRASDFDKDGDLDLFIGADVYPVNIRNLSVLLFTEMILKTVK